MSLTLATQKAIVDALSAALSADVYGTPTIGATLPYVDMTVQATPAGRNDRTLDCLTASLTVWTEGRGNTQAEQILETIRATLDDARLPLETGGHASTRVTQRSSEPDISEQIYIGRATVRVFATR